MSPAAVVLVVDPNPATFRRVEEALGERGWTLRSARDAVEAEAQLASQDLRLALTAISLPRGNGYELARLLRERQPAARVLLLTGGFEVLNRSRAEEAGVAGHIGKPFTVDALRTKVDELLSPPALDPQVLEPLPSEAALIDLPVEALVPLAAESPAPVVIPRYEAPISHERVAAFLARDYKAMPLVSVDAAVVAPAIEKAILEVLPEVVEGVLRRSLITSPAFRDLVAGAVDEAIRARLPDLARQIAAGPSSPTG
jgi:CheY-like chemotaxis protein